MSARNGGSPEGASDSSIRVIASDDAAAAVIAYAHNLTKTLCAHRGDAALTWSDWLHHDTSYQELHMTKKPNAGDGERQRRPIASIVLRTGGLTARCGTANALSSLPSGNGSRTPAGEATMGNVIYEAYRRNPNLREQVEREARVTRAKEMDRLIVAPPLRWLRRTFSRAPSEGGARFSCDPP